jgi:hypothetical protein
MLPGIETENEATSTSAFQTWIVWGATSAQAASPVGVPTITV